MDDAVGSELGARRRQAEAIAFWSLTVLGAAVMCLAGPSFHRAGDGVSQGASG